MQMQLSEQEVKNFRIIAYYSELQPDFLRIIKIKLNLYVPVPTKSSNLCHLFRPRIAEAISTTLCKAVCFVEENGYGLAFERGVEATLGRAIDE